MLLDCRGNARILPGAEGTAATSSGEPHFCGKNTTDTTPRSGRIF
jgi:hypothetical protein